MQATIQMAQALLDRGRELWNQDRIDEATQVLTRLLGQRSIPLQIAEQAQFYLGDLHLTLGNYAKARRHLAAAIACGTNSGETHFLMACALDWDPEADQGHAYTHYRRAVELDPGQPLYSSSYALMRIRRKGPGTKYDRESLRRLRDAFAADPNDIEIVYNYIQGLMELGRSGEAELALRRARKQWVGHPGFEELWVDFNSRRGQLASNRSRSENPAEPRSPEDDIPVLLPFPRQDLARRPIGPRARRAADTASGG
jgi:tetratricopeptide (TPR) repeat protein